MKISEKIRILEQKGYKYIFDRDIFCNYENRKCFSLEFIEDNPIEIIESKMMEPGDKDITFYFNIEPSIPARMELQNELNKIFSKQT